MSKEYSNTRVCDQCSKRVVTANSGRSDPSTYLRGTAVDEGWFLVEEKDTSDSRPLQEWDFCSWGCMARYAFEKNDGF